MGTRGLEAPFCSETGGPGMLSADVVSFGGKASGASPQQGCTQSGSPATEAEVNDEAESFGAWSGDLP